MRRLPHRAQILRPTITLDGYGDEVLGPLAPHGDPIPAWRQRITSTEASGVTRTEEVLYLLPGADLHADDVVEVNEERFQVDGHPYAAVNPRGRAVLLRADLKAVQRGGVQSG